MRVPKSPVHPLSVFVTMALDGIWHVLKFDMSHDSTLLIIGGIGFVGWVVVALVERFIASQTWKKSLTVGLALGILAAVPYMISPVLGTPLLFWSGAHKVQEQYFPTPNNLRTDEKK